MGAATFREWNGSALVPLTIRDAGDRAELRRNHNSNPEFKLDATGYGRVTGTGGVAVLSREPGPGADGVTPGFGRALWSTASSSSGGINVTSTTLMAATIAAGSVWSLQAAVRLNVARTVSFGGYPRSGFTGSTATQVKVAVPANVWTPLSVTLAPSTIAGDNLYAYCYFDGAPNAPAAGDWMDLDQVMAEPGPGSPYFYGDTPDTLAAGYEWAGPDGASQSIERDPRGGAFTAWIV